MDVIEHADWNDDCGGTRDPFWLAWAIAVTCSGVRGLSFDRLTYPE